MGCCHDRDFSFATNDPKEDKLPACPESEGSVGSVHRLEYKPLVQTSDPQQSTADTLTVNYPTVPKSPTFNTEVQMLGDREKYVMSLISGAEKWLVAYETDKLIVKFLSGSKFAKDVQIVYFYMDFDVNIPFEKALLALENLKIRKEWDESISELQITKVEETEYETCYTKYQVFGMDRDFVERRHRVQTENELKIAFFSVLDSAYPHSDSRGTNHLGLYRFGKSERGTTDVLIFTQYDYNLHGEQLQKLKFHRGESAKNWLEAFQAQVQSLVPS